MRWAAAVAIWAACVALVAGAAWFAIDSAGRQVSILSGAPAGATGGDSVVVRPAPAATDAPSAPDPTLGPATSTGEPTDPPASRTSRPPDDDPSDGGDDGDDPPSDRPSSRTSDRRTPRPEPDVTVRSRSVSTRAGTVTLTCPTSGQIDYAVRPAQGWSAHGERSGPAEVEVELERGADKVEVHGRCVGGEPRVEVEDHDEDDHGDD